MHQFVTRRLLNSFRLSVISQLQHQQHFHTQSSEHSPRSSRDHNHNQSQFLVYREILLVYREFEITTSHHPSFIERTLVYRETKTTISSFIERTLVYRETVFIISSYIESLNSQIFPRVPSASHCILLCRSTQFLLAPTFEHACKLSKDQPAEI